MNDALLLGVALLTSLLAILVFRKRARGGLMTAVGLVLEAAGATVLFFAANLAVGVTLVLLARRVWFYTTLYDVTDVSLLILSLFQAITITAWLRLR